MSKMLMVRNHLERAIQPTRREAVVRRGGGLDLNSHHNDQFPVEYDVDHDDEYDDHNSDDDHNDDNATTCHTIALRF